MESLIVHPKNQMELNALKATLKDMGIKFEKFHTRTLASAKTPAKKPIKPASPKKKED